MTKTQYLKNVKKYALVGSGLVVGSISGMAAGFALGSLVFPGVGSIVGAVAGAIGGTIAGEKLSIKAYASIERQIEEMSERDRRRLAWLEAEEQKYEQALFVFNATERTSTDIIQLSYQRLMQSSLSESEEKKM